MLPCDACKVLKDRETNKEHVMVGVYFVFDILEHLGFHSIDFQYYFFIFWLVVDPENGILMPYK